MASRHLASTLFLASVVVGVSGCSDNPSCSRGSSDVDKAVQAFLLAVQDGDRAMAESQLVVGMEMSDQEFDELRSGLDGVDLDSVFVSVSSETPGAYQISVTGPDGTLVGRYFANEMTGRAPGCVGMNEGHPGDPDPGAVVTPSAASTVAP
jgi:hypothetical protein